MKTKNKSRVLGGGAISTSLNRRGQAAIEFILMLVVSVALVLGLAYQFFHPFQDFVKNSLGTYTQCLLETGEVPALGGNSNIKEDPSTCGFKLGLAKDLPPSGSTSSGGPDSANSKSSGASGPSSSDSANGAQGGSSSVSSSNSPPLYRNGSAGDTGGRNGKVTQVPVNQLPESQETFRASGESVWQLRNERGKKALNLTSDQISKKDRENLDANKNKGNKVLSTNGFAKPNKKTIVHPPERTVASDEVEEGYSFGDYFRIFFIVIIVLLLIIVVGGQAYKMAQGWEK